MDFLQWMERMSVNVTVLDDDHKKLIGLINRVHEVVERGGAREQVNAIVSELIDYTEYHFSREENMMEKAGYPALEDHKQLHAALVEKIKDYEQALNEDLSQFEPMNLLEFLSRWLMQHILHEDRKYKPYMKEAE